MNRRKVNLGLILGAVAEIGSVGLLAASGWFITACALAGLYTIVSFSYLFPSAVVQAFAMTRVVAHYFERVILHEAALDEVARTRTDMFRRAAAVPRGRVHRGGELLDRAVSDADQAGMKLIRATSPKFTFWAVLAVSTIVVLVISWVAGLGVLVTGLAAYALAKLVAERVDTHSDAEITEARAQSRTAITDSVAAWPELISLGVGSHVQGRVRDSLISYADRGATQKRGQSWSVATLGALGGVATAVVTALAWYSGADEPNTILVLLLMVGLVNPTQSLVAAFREEREADEAQERLDHLETDAVRRDIPVNVLIDDAGVVRIGYDIPQTATSRLADPGSAATLRRVDVVATVSAPLIATGASGSGKTTFLRALHEQLEGRDVLYVAVDDYMFTGSVAANLKLGAPEATDEELREILKAVELDYLDLDERIGVTGREISGGEATRIRVARAIAAQPGILLLDEPLTGLDTDSARRVLEALRDMLPATIIVAAIHDAELATQVWSEIHNIAF